MEEASWVTVHLVKNPPSQQMPNLTQTRAKVAPGSQCQAADVGGLVPCLRPTEEDKSTLKACSPCLAQVTRPARWTLPAAARCGFFGFFWQFQSFLMSYLSLYELVKPLCGHFHIFMHLLAFVFNLFI